MLVNVAALVTVDRDFPSATADDRAFTGLDAFDIVDVASREPILVLLGDVDVFLHVLGSRPELDAPGIVEPGPLVLATLHQLVEDDAGDGAMRHSIS